MKKKIVSCFLTRFLTFFPTCCVAPLYRFWLILNNLIVIWKNSKNQQKFVENKNLQYFHFFPYRLRDRTRDLRYSKRKSARYTNAIKVYHLSICLSTLEILININQISGYFIVFGTYMLNALLYITHKIVFTIFRSILF